MPSLSGSTSDDVLLGNTIPSTATATEAEAPTKKEEPEEKEGDGSGAVKANKGMILRKSVEYIR